MASTVYSSEAIKLQDGKEIVLVPLAIGRLRRFMAAWGKVVDVDGDDEIFDIYINCCGIALEKLLKDDFPVTKGETEDEVLNATYREYLEDVLDIETVNKILEVCGGLKLNDPKFLEEMERAAAAAQVAAVGQN